MTNNQMIEGRFLRWHKARKMFAAIQNELSKGRRIQITTYTGSTIYSAKHVAMFKATKYGVYVQHGKRWDCIDHCNIRSVE